MNRLVVVASVSLVWGVAMGVVYRDMAKPAVDNKARLGQQFEHRLSPGAIAAGMEVPAANASWARARALALEPWRVATHSNHSRAQDTVVARHKTSNSSSWPRLDIGTRRNGTRAFANVPILARTYINTRALTHAH